MSNENESDVEMENEEVEEVISTNGPTSRRQQKSKKRKIQFRWNDGRDLFLVSEISNMQPYLHEKSTTIYKDIADAVSKEFGAKVDDVAVKRRFQRLLKDFKTEDSKNRYKSGTEEVITELNNKLANIANLMTDLKDQEAEKTESRKRKVEDEKKAADEIREAAFVTMKRSNNADSLETSKPSKRMNDSTLMTLWKEKQDKEEVRILAEKDFREKELQLKQQQLDFEREKFEHQKKKEDKELELKEKKIAVENEEKKVQINTQKLLMEMLLKKI